MGCALREEFEHVPHRSYENMPRIHIYRVYNAYMVRYFIVDAYSMRHKVTHIHSHTHVRTHAHMTKWIFSTNNCCVRDCVCDPFSRFAVIFRCELQSLLLGMPIMYSSFHSSIQFAPVCWTWTTDETATMYFSWTLAAYYCAIVCYAVVVVKTNSCELNPEWSVYI